MSAFVEGDALKIQRDLLRIQIRKLQAVVALAGRWVESIEADRISLVRVPSVTLENGHTQEEVDDNKKRPFEFDENFDAAFISKSLDMHNYLSSQTSNMSSSNLNANIRGVLYDVNVNRAIIKKHIDGADVFILQDPL